MGAPNYSWQRIRLFEARLGIAREEPPPKGRALGQRCLHEKCHAPATQVRWQPGPGVAPLSSFAPRPRPRAAGADRYPPPPPPRHSADLPPSSSSGFLKPAPGPVHFAPSGGGVGGVYPTGRLNGRRVDLTVGGLFVRAAAPKLGSLTKREEDNKGFATPSPTGAGVASPDETRMRQIGLLGVGVPKKKKRTSYHSQSKGWNAEVGACALRKKADTLLSRSAYVTSLVSVPTFVKNQEPNDRKRIGFLFLLTRPRYGNTKRKEDSSFQHALRRRKAPPFCRLSTKPFTSTGRRGKWERRAFWEVSVGLCLI